MGHKKERNRYDPEDANDDEMMTINMYETEESVSADNAKKRMMDVIEVELFVVVSGVSGMRN